MDKTTKKAKKHMKPDGSMEKIHTRDDECPFVEGEEIYVRFSENGKWLTREFYSFVHDLAFPFLCLEPLGGECGRAYGKSYRYAKKILPDFKVDDKVWVRDDEQDTWNKRHFKGWSIDWYMRCFEGGKTSHSDCGRWTKWEHFTTEDPNKHECCK